MSSSDMEKLNFVLLLPFLTAASASAKEDEAVAFDIFNKGIILMKLERLIKNGMVLSYLY